MATITPQVYRLVKERVEMDLAQLWAAFQSKPVIQLLKHYVKEQQILVVDTDTMKTTEEVIDDIAETVKE